MAKFTNYEQRVTIIESFLQKYGIDNLEQAEAICRQVGLDVFDAVRTIQPICFDDACWAYTAGAAALLKSSLTSAG